MWSSRQMPLCGFLVFEGEGEGCLPGGLMRVDARCHLAHHPSKNPKP